MEKKRLLFIIQLLVKEDKVGQRDVSGQRDGSLVQILEVKNEKKC